jgi:hypothetical protein
MIRGSVSRQIALAVVAAMIVDQHLLVVFVYQQGHTDVRTKS